MAFFLSAVRFFLDCQPIPAYNGVVMSNTSNEVEYEYRPSTFTTSVEALKSYSKDLQEIVEMKCRENMVRSLFKEANKQEESKWSVYDTLTREPVPGGRPPVGCAFLDWKLECGVLVKLITTHIRYV